MAKGKKDKKKKKKGKASDEGTSTQTSAQHSEIQFEEPKEEPKDIQKIDIVIESLKNIRAIYPVSYLHVKSEYNNKVVNESEKSVVVNGFVEADIKFSIEIDILSSKEIDILVSKPVTFTVYQTFGKPDPDIASQLDNYDTLNLEKKAVSCDSGISVYEPIPVVKAKAGGKKGKKSGKKGSKKGSKKSGKKGSKKSSKKGSKKGSKKSSKKGSKKGSKKSSKKGGKKKKKGGAESVPTKWDKKKGLADTMVVGICTMDMIPLVLGNKNFSAVLELKPLVHSGDDELMTYKDFPKMLVSASIEKPIQFSSELSIMSFTLESILNVPSMMNGKMDYKVCAWVPLSDTIAEKQIFQNSVYKTENVQYRMKCWPSTPVIGDNVNTTTYKLNTDLMDVKHTLEKDLASFIDTSNARLIYNYMKRNVLLENNRIVLRNYLVKYRMLLIEVFMGEKEDLNADGKSTASEGGKSKKSKKSKKGSKSSKSSKNSKSSKSSKSSRSSKSSKGKKGKKGKKDGKKSKSKDSLHLMALLDISTLVYPGVTRLRAACQLTSYQEKEAERATGIFDSYFVPKLITTIETLGSKGSTSGKSKKGKRKGKKGKSSTSSGKSSKSKGKGKGKGKKKKGSSTSGKSGSEGGKSVAPPPEVPEEPSVKVYNEMGHPTVIIIEIELTEPLIPKRPFPELIEDIINVIDLKKIATKPSVTLKVAEEDFKSTIREINNDLTNNYASYLEDKELCQCTQQADFVTYIQRTGSFQNYASTLSEATKELVSKKFGTRKFEQLKEDRAVIPKLYVHLVHQTNYVLNTRHCIPIAKETSFSSSHEILLFAKEATETKRFWVSEKFYKERLTSQKYDPSVWFDYAIFQLEMDSRAIAFQYLDEALSRQIDHSNSLLLYALLLADKEQVQKSETCLMVVLENHPHRAEVWAILFLLFRKNNNTGGMNFAEDMAMKYSHEDTAYDDYFMNTDDLIWTSVDCPRTLFFRTAILLLKLRMYSWVEDALAFEINNHPGYVKYLLAASSYYKGAYDQALNFLNEAKLILGWNYGIVALTGHCLLWKNDLEAGKDEYYHVLGCYDRPDDMHMLYVNSATCLGLLGEHRTARQLMLTACKYHSTPLAWMSAGIYYYNAHDLLSAEECFTEANVCNNTSPEIWAYLTLVNLKLDREIEYELCYRQTIRYNLEDDKLLTAINEEIATYQQRNSDSY